MPADTTPRYRTLVSTQGKVFWHPCKVCGDVNAPYGYNVVRRSRGQWAPKKDHRGHTVGQEWRGQDAEVDHGDWYCAKDRPGGAT